MAYEPNYDDLFVDDYEETHGAQLKRILKTLIGRLKPRGTLLIVDVERHYNGNDGTYGNVADPRYGGRKASGFGIKGVTNVLDWLGMENAEVTSNHYFEWKPSNEKEAKVLPSGRSHMFFMVKATKGEKYLETMNTTCLAYGKSPEDSGEIFGRCEGSECDALYCSCECADGDWVIHQKQENCDFEYPDVNYDTATVSAPEP